MVDYRKIRDKNSIEPYTHAEWVVNGGSDFEMDPPCRAIMLDGAIAYALGSSAYTLPAVQVVFADSNEIVTIDITAGIIYPYALKNVKSDLNAAAGEVMVLW